MQRGITVIPKSISRSRIQDNIKLVTLTKEELTAINSAHKIIGKFRIANGIELLHHQIDGKRTLQGWSYADLGWEDEQGNWLL